MNEIISTSGEIPDQITPSKNGKQNKKRIMMNEPFKIVWSASSPKNVYIHIPNDSDIQPKTDVRLYIMDAFGNMCISQKKVVSVGRQGWRRVQLPKNLQFDPGEELVCMFGEPVGHEHGIFVYIPNAPDGEGLDGTYDQYELVCDVTKTPHLQVYIPPSVYPEPNLLAQIKVRSTDGTKGFTYNGALSSWGGGYKMYLPKQEGFTEGDVAICELTPMDRVELTGDEKAVYDRLLEVQSNKP